MRSTSYVAIALGVAATTLALASPARADNNVTVTPAQPPPAQPSQPVVVVPQQQAPATAPAAESGVRRVESGPNTAMIGTGLVVLGVTYGASAIVAGTSDHQGDSHLYVPIVGPWMDLADRGGCPAGQTCDSEATSKVMLVLDGIFQGAGVLAILGGFLSPETREVTTTTTTSSAKPKPLQVRVTPARMGRGGSGVAIVGTF